MRDLNLRETEKWRPTVTVEDLHQVAVLTDQAVIMRQLPTTKQQLTIIARLDITAKKGIVTTREDIHPKLMSIPHEHMNPLHVYMTDPSQSRAQEVRANPTAAHLAMDAATSDAPSSMQRQADRAIRMMAKTPQVRDAVTLAVLSSMPKQADRAIRTTDRLT